MDTFADFEEITENFLLDIYNLKKLCYNEGVKQPLLICLVLQNTVTINMEQTITWQ